MIVLSELIKYRYLKVENHIWYKDDKNNTKVSLDKLKFEHLNNILLTIKIDMKKINKHLTRNREHIKLEKSELVDSFKHENITLEKVLKSAKNKQVYIKKLLANQK